VIPVWPSANVDDADARVFRHAPPRLAVTGGIGGGKSTALAFLGELGAATLSSDAIVHDVYGHAEIIAAVEGRFGAQVIVGGQVNRHALSKLVFDDPEALDWLEQLTHPLVRRRVEEWAAEQQALLQPPSLLAVEVPLFFESGRMGDMFDCVLLVTAPADERRRRLSAKLTGEEFDRRVKRQMSEEEKAERSHFVFENVGSRKRMKQFLTEVFASILAWVAVAEGPTAVPIGGAGAGAQASGEAGRRAPARRSSPTTHPAFERKARS
jgi:dephospho-CoA kinase